jgi:hypothetical protein
MFDSLLRHHNDFYLYIFAFDDFTCNYISSLNSEKISVISLAEFEDEELLNVKPGRSRAEYCWTSTSSTVLYCLENFKLDHCTYIDADLLFYSSPQCLIEEMGTASVLITEHRSTPMYDRSKIAGKYCVQFITFKNDEKGLKVLKWWRDACIDWCYDRYEDGKFGDQKYLDDWTERFDAVHVLKHEGGGLAPWNIQQYRVGRKDGKLHCINKKNKTIFDIVFYHFHYVRFLNEKKVDLGWLPLSANIIKNIYRPYLQDIIKINSEIIKKNSGYKPLRYVLKFNVAAGLKENMKVLIKKITGFNIIRCS